MIGVRVQIVRFVDEADPGFVECELLDAHGRRWLFVEKGPVVTSDYLTAQDSYPRPGVIACAILGRTGQIAHIDTASPWGIESTQGETKFDVQDELLVEW